MKKIAILVIVLLLLSIVAFSGCTVFEERTDNTFSSQKKTTECGIGGCKTQTKQCPFWNRDC